MIPLLYHPPVIRSRALVGAASLLLAFGGMAGTPASASGQSGGTGLPPDTTIGAEPSYPRIVFGTVGGGLVGAAVVGGVAGLLGEALGEDEEIVPMGAVWMTLAAPVGYWLGQAMGASRAASGPGHRVTTGELLLPAALWTGAGLATYVLIGDGFDPEGGAAPDYTSWYVGAALGAALQITAMSVTAYRAAVGKHRSGGEGAASLRVVPRPDGRADVEARIPVGR